ncbi:hypothetical protein ACHWQZ_G003625 [Mnemiopsis leidyi]
MPDDISSLSPVRRILRRNNTIVLLHRLREVRKRNRESIKRSRQRIRESPQVRRSTRFEVKKAETPGIAGPSNLGTDHESRPNEKISGELSELGIEPFKELVTVWSRADSLKRPKSLTIVGMDQMTETGRVCDDQRGASFNSKRHSKPVVKDIIFQEQNRDVLLDLTPSRLPQVPEQDIIVTNTNDDVTFATPPRSHLDIKAITPVLNMEEEARRKVAQYSNPFLQDLYRKERILLMARIMAKVEKDRIPSNTLLSFLSMLFCCFCIGFMALGSSVRAKECKMKKQYYGAKIHANRAKRWAIAAIIAGICIYGFCGCMYFVYDIAERFATNHVGYDEIAGKEVIQHKDIREVKEEDVHNDADRFGEKFGGFFEGLNPGNGRTKG